jgi:hypothetical protein
MNKIPKVTLWGDTVNTTEIARGIYQVDAARQSGVMVQRSAAARELSEDAARSGLGHGDWLYYDENNQAVVFRELMDKPDCDFMRNGAEILRDTFARYIDKSLREYCPDYWGYRLWRLTGGGR